MTPDIELFALLPMPVQKQTESVTDFIRKSAIGINKNQEHESEKPANFT